MWLPFACVFGVWIRVESISSGVARGRAERAKKGRAVCHRGLGVQRDFVGKKRRPVGERSPLRCRTFPLAGSAWEPAGRTCTPTLQTWKPGGVTLELATHTSRLAARNLELAGFTCQLARETWTLAGFTLELVGITRRLARITFTLEMRTSRQFPPTLTHAGENHPVSTVRWRAQGSTQRTIADEMARKISVGGCGADR